MITIELYINTSEPNVVHKQLTQIGTYEGAFRDSVTVTDPVFTVEVPSNAVNDAVFVNCNYARITAFGRWYYVTQVVLVRTGLWQFSCHVDVLKTYWDTVKMLPAVLARQENEYNLYLDDDRFLVTCKRIYNTIAFPGRVASGSGDNNTSFILTLAGGVGDEAVVEST